MADDKKDLGICEVLTRPAEEFVNDSVVEMSWMSTAIKHMEAYYKLITSVDCTAIRLTPNDDEIFETFKQQFPELEVKTLTEQMIKSEEAKVKWRKFCMDLEQKVEDFNFATLLRLDSQQDYKEENTIVVPRAQFLAIEIARNRQNYNTNLPPPE